MTIRYPIQYEISPKSIAAGTRWVTVRLENIGIQDLTGLSVRLNSLDEYSLRVRKEGTYVDLLAEGEEKELPFQIEADLTGEVYVTIDGYQDEAEPFHWESPGVLITVGRDLAELVRVVSLAEPYPRLGETIEVEAVVRGLELSNNLVVEIWAETPSGTLLSLDKMGLGELDAGEEKRRSVEIKLDEEGIYTFHAYLFNVNRRIGHRVEFVSVAR